MYVLTVEYGGQTYNLCHEVSRRQEDDKLFDFERCLNKLPLRLSPPKGYHLGSDLGCRGRPGLMIHVIWDGGGEGASVSDRCLSRILRAQRDLPPGRVCI